MSIQSDIQKLVPGGLVEMFVIEFGAETYRFHSGVNELGNDLVWQGSIYNRRAIEASGFEWKTGGTLPRPKMKVANIGGVLSALVREHDDLVGAKVTRKRTLVKYLDAANFPGGVNPTADPNAALPDEVYLVDRKAAQNGVFIEFELATAMDVTGVRLPRRQVIQNLCAWIAIGGYRGTYCGYTGGPVADKYDQPTTDPTKDQCAGRLSSCKLRYGANNQLPFGGFPSAGLIR